MIYYLYTVSVHLLTQEQICVKLLIRMLILVNNRIAVNTVNQYKYIVLLKKWLRSKEGKTMRYGPKNYGTKHKIKIMGLLVQSNATLICILNNLVVTLKLSTGLDYPNKNE
jgi:hypothetical protein